MSDHFHSAGWIIPFSVFIAGFIGSPHCMSMCGPIVMNFARDNTQAALYQFGRALSYVSIGACLGAFGHVLWSNELWISTTSLALVSVLLVVNGVRALRGLPLHFQLPKRLQHAVAAAYKFSRMPSLPPVAASFFAGGLTVFLPCGHLYSFLLGAMTTGSAGRGAGFMFAFWLGSTPLLSFGSLGLRKLLATRPARAQRIAGALLIAAGLFSVLTFGARTFDLYQQHSMGQEVPSKNQAPRCH